MPHRPPRDPTPRRTAPPARRPPFPAGPRPFPSTAAIVPPRHSARPAWSTPRPSRSGALLLGLRDAPSAHGAYETIDLDVRDGVAHLTLNRPDAANGINLALAHDLLDATLGDRRRPRGPGRAADRRGQAVLRRRRREGLRGPRRPPHPPARDPRPAPLAITNARAGRRAGGGRGAGERGRRGHGPRRRVRPRRGGRSRRSS